MPLTGKYIPGNSLIHKFDVQGKIIVFIILIFMTIFANSSIVFYSSWNYNSSIKISLKTYIFFYKTHMEIFYCYFYFKYVIF